MSIDYNITLKEQPTQTVVKIHPSQQWLTENKYSAGSDYEEMTYTGTQEQIAARRSEALNTGGSTQQVTTTMTRLNGNMWQLVVRTAPLTKIKEDEQEEEEGEDGGSTDQGTSTNPKQLSIAITAVQESVLNHSKFANLSPQQRGAIKAYMNGAMEGQKVADADGKAIRLGQIMPMNDALVQLALKCPTYFVPSIAVTFQYYSASAVTNVGQIGSEKAAPGGFSKLPQGYKSIFMGCASSPAPNGKGYIVQESYTIGKFNTELSDTK